MMKTLPENAILIPDNAQLVFKGEIFDVYQWPQKMFDGGIKTFEMLKRPDTVQIIAIKEDKIVLVNDKQPNRDARLHFPGGRADEAGENWLEAAKREMHEETGMSFDSWRLVAVYQPMIKIEQFVPWFIATSLTNEVSQKLDSGEQITIESHDFDTVKQLVGSGDGTLSYAIPLFTGVGSLEDLISLSEFKGREVDR